MIDVSIPSRLIVGRVRRVLRIYGEHIRQAADGTWSIVREDGRVVEQGLHIVNIARALSCIRRWEKISDIDPPPLGAKLLPRRFAVDRRRGLIEETAPAR